MKRLFGFFALVSVLASLVVGCGGAGKAYVPEVDGAAGFILSGGGTATVAPGAAATYTFTVALTGSGTGMVGRSLTAASMSVHGLPVTVSGSFNPNPVPLETSGNDTVLTLTTSGATPAGTYPFTVRATDGTVTKSRSATLVVSAGAPGFSLRGGGQATVLVGGSAVFDIGVSKSNPSVLRSVDQVTLRVLSGTHASMTTSFDLNPVTLGDSETVSHLTVQTSSTTPPGPYTIVVEGTNGVETKTTMMSLQVNAPGVFELTVTPVDPFVADEDGNPFGADREATYTVTMKVPSTFVGTVELDFAFVVEDVGTGGGSLTGGFRLSGEPIVNPITFNYPAGVTQRTATLAIQREGSLTFTGDRSFRVRAKPSIAGFDQEAFGTVTIRDNGGNPPP